MSFRTWVGPNLPDLPQMFDFCSFDYPDIASLAKVMNWRMPARLYFDPSSRAEVGELLFLLSEEHGMVTNEFWHISEIGGHTVSDPTEKEVEDVFGIKIEMRQQEIA